MEVQYKITDFPNLSNEDLLDQFGLLAVETNKPRGEESFLENSFRMMGIVINLHYCICECVQRGLVDEKDLDKIITVNTGGHIDPFNIISQN